MGIGLYKATSGNKRRTPRSITVIGGESQAGDKESSAWFNRWSHKIIGEQNHEWKIHIVMCAFACTP
jgi:hypothetical protein